MVFFMGWFRPSRALLGFEEFLDGSEGGSNECNLTEQVCLEDSKGYDTEEEGDEGGELQLDQGEDREEFLQLLLLLATA